MDIARYTAMAHLVRSSDGDWVNTHLDTVSGKGVIKAKKKMVKGGVSEKNITKMKLRPGDLVFQTGAKNGRYKGIYHVEMFVGYRCYGFNGSTPMLMPCWAARYDGYAYGAKLVGRP